MNKDVLGLWSFNIKKLIKSHGTYLVVRIEKKDDWRVVLRQRHIWDQYLVYLSFVVLLRLLWSLFRMLFFYLLLRWLRWLRIRPWRPPRRPCWRTPLSLSILVYNDSGDSIFNSKLLGNVSNGFASFYDALDECFAPLS